MNVSDAMWTNKYISEMLHSLEDISNLFFEQ